MGMKGIYNLILICTCIFSLNACTSIQNTYSEVDTSADFGGFKSFAWLPKDSSQITNILYDNSFVKNRIQNSVNKELASRGLGISKNPDIYLQYTIVVDKTQRLLSYPVYSYVGVTPQSVFYPFTPLYPYDFSYALSYQYELNTNPYYSNTYIMPPINSANQPVYNPNLPQYPFMYKPNMVGSNFQQVEFDEGTVVIDVIDTKKGELIWRGWSVGTFDNAKAFQEQVDNIVNYIFDRFPVKESKEAK